jgi:hypothetical protein
VKVLDRQVFDRGGPSHVQAFVHAVQFPSVRLLVVHPQQTRNRTLTVAVITNGLSLPETLKHHILISQWQKSLQSNSKSTNMANTNKYYCTYNEAFINLKKSIQFFLKFYQLSILNEVEVGSIIVGICSGNTYFITLYQMYFIPYRK